MISEDPALYLADFGVPVASNGTTGLGIFDMPGEYVLDDMQISTDYMVRCEAAKFGELKYGDELLVNGGQYEVRDNRLLDDGVFCLVTLSKVLVSLNRLLIEAGGVLLSEDGYALLQEG